MSYEPLHHVDGTEYHIFVIWSSAKEHRKAILDDMAQRFSAILHVYRITWSPRSFYANLCRFYGEPRHIMAYKMWHCGIGSFDLIVVRDTAPQYETRHTTKGLKSVNVNSFDAKAVYREMSGGGHRIHATNNPTELAHDLVLMLGIDPLTLESTLTWDGQIRERNQGLVGFGGWQNLKELFFVLNHTVNYVVLRNEQHLPDDHRINGHDDIDLLSDDPQRFLRVAQATPSRKFGRPALATVRVQGQRIPIDLRSCDDGYYDPSFSCDILTRRIRNNKNIYTPNARDAYLAQLYHAAIHKRSIPNDVCIHLQELADSCGLPTPSRFDESMQIKMILDQLLSQNGYVYVEPKDPSVHFNAAIAGRKPKMWIRKYLIPIYRQLRGVR